MAVFGGKRIHADPKTDSQLRAALAAAQGQTDDLSDSLATLADFVGPVSATFTSAAAVGNVVYASASATVDLADATDNTKYGAVGVVSTAAGAGAQGEYITAGQITQDDWTAIAGAENLTVGSMYYLSTTGAITATPPSTKNVVEIGVALSGTTLAVRIRFVARMR